MERASYKLTIMLFAIAAAAFAGPAYAGGPQADTVVTPGVSGGSLPWPAAGYVADQGPTFELTHWRYRQYYRSYGYTPYYYGYGYRPYYSYGYPYFRHHHRHFRHFGRHRFRY
jgi:hypothetical protein